MRLSARAAVVLCLSPFALPSAEAQVSLTTLGSPYTQDFDSLATSGTTNPWADNTTISGWYSQFSLVPANPTVYRADAGGTNAGAIYSWGTGTATERAFGSIGSGTPGNILNAVRLLNNTGSTITSLLVSFTGEQWRAGGCTGAGCTPAVQPLDFQFQVAATGTITDANTPATGWTDHDALDFVSPTPGVATAAALDGNAAANRLALSSTITVTVNAGEEIWLRWFDTNDANNDHGLSIDDLSVTPQGGGGLNLSIDDVSASEGDAGTTNFTFTVTLSSPAPGGGVTFDIATSDGTAQDDNPPAEDSDYVAQALVAETIPAGSSTYTFTVLVNGDAVVEGDETFFVNVTNVLPVTVTVTDGQGLGTILNDDVALVFIHDVQGSGAATPMPGATVSVEGVVIGDFQAATQTKGLFLQEEDADHDLDPLTSEGIFVFCNTCPTAVAEGQRVRVTGTVSEFFGNTEITASTAGSVVVTEAGNHLAEVTPEPIDLPVAGVVDDFYEPREGMRVTFVDTLTVSEYFELARFGQIELFEGGRPRQFTETAPPSVAGYTAHLEALSRRRVILDDDDNGQNVSLNDPDGSQFIYHPRANGGFSVGTQGGDFFRGGDLVNGLTGVLDWSFAGVTGTDAWRIRPTAANLPAFTVANPRPPTPPTVGGAIRAVGMNLLNYFTTIDTTAGGAGPCGPGGTLDCRGADSVAELDRQRERAAIVICTLNADVYGFGELENTTPSDTITDLLGAVNARCGGAHPYTFVDTGGTLGTDAIRVALIYRTGILAPFGDPLSDLDPIHSRPPTAQTFDVVDAANPAFGQRFTVIPNHLKSKGSSAGLPGDEDAGDGAGASNTTRTLQATRLLAWISNTVLPAAADPDVLLLGDFNSYAQETPITTLTGGGFTDLETALLGAAAYSYLFDGQLGHLDYAFSSASLTPQITGVGAWHINADEANLLDYNDEVRDVGESAFEEKPDGAALSPPRVLFEPATPYRASDHDPVVVGLFPVADLAVTKTDGVATATPGGTVTYTIVAANAGPEADPVVAVADTFAPSLTCTWTCVGAGGGTCTAAGAGSIDDSANLPVGGSATYTASCSIASTATGSLVNTATVTADGGAGDPDHTNNSATDTDTLTAQADLGITKTDGVTSVTAGGTTTYSIVASNAGPSAAPGSTVTDSFPAALSCSTTCTGAGGGTCTAGPFAANINDTVNLPVGGSVTYTSVCSIAAGATGNLANTASVTTAGGINDATPGNNSATDTDAIAQQADLSITKTDGVSTAQPGTNTIYTIVASNSGPSSAPTAAVVDNFPEACTTATWTCAGSGGGTCAASGSGSINQSVNLPAGASVTFTAVCAIAAGATGTLENTAAIGVGANDPNPADNSATDIDTLSNDLFADGFESGDTSQWSASVPLTFETYVTAGIGAGATEAAFDYDFAAVAPGEAFPATSIAVATNAAGRPLFELAARRLEANGQLELTLEIVGGGRSSWVSAAEAGQQVRLEWSAAGDSDGGHVAVALDGRLVLWVEGYAGSVTPAGVLLLRSPAPVAP